MAHDPGSGAGLTATDLETSAALLERWAIAHYGDGALIEGLRPMPGHAGISFGFDVLHDSRRDPLVVRVPPHGVRRHGNTDVLRQVPVLQAAQADGVPVATVRWWSDDERWFGTPYFMVERLPGSALDCWEPAEIDAATVGPVFRQAVEALVSIHAVRWRERLNDWCCPRTLSDEIAAWEPILEKGGNSDWTKQALDLRDRLLATRPAEPEPGLLHGDFYSNNWVCAGDGLLAVVDWEIAAIGPCLLDVGWLCLMYDWESWGPTRQTMMTWSPSAEEIAALYESASGQSIPNLDWYRALAAWRLSAITALNYRLHVTGRRPDSTWDIIGEAFIPMVERARRLVGG